MARLASADPTRLLAHVLPSRGAWWRETIRAVSEPASDPARRRLGKPVRGMQLGRRGKMVQRVSTDACAAVTLPETDWLLFSANREWSSRQEAVFVQRVLRRHLVRRPAPGRFVHQSSEEIDTEEVMMIDG